MKKTVTLGLVFVVAMLTVALADQDTEDVTFEGEVVDIGCYASREARGPEHQACASRCLTNGNPAGILLEDGRVFTIAASAPAYTELAARTVRITGKLRGPLLRPAKLSVWEDGAWRDVPLNQFGAPDSSKDE